MMNLIIEIMIILILAKEKTHLRIWKKMDKKKLKLIIIFLKN